MGQPYDMPAPGPLASFGLPEYLPEPYAQQGTPADVERKHIPNVLFTSLAEGLYQGMVHPNLTTREDRTTQLAIPFDSLANVAGQMTPPANTSSKSPPGARMSILLRQFEQSLLRIQNFVLGAP